MPFEINQINTALELDKTRFDFQNIDDFFSSKSQNSTDLHGEVAPAFIVCFRLQQIRSRIFENYTKFINALDKGDLDSVWNLYIRSFCETLVHNKVKNESDRKTIRDDLITFLTDPKAQENSIKKHKRILGLDYESILKIRACKTKKNFLEEHYKNQPHEYLSGLLKEEGLKIITGEKARGFLKNIHNIKKNYEKHLKNSSPTIESELVSMSTVDLELFKKNYMSEQLTDSLYAAANKQGRGAQYLANIHHMRDIKLKLLEKAQKILEDKLKADAKKAEEETKRRIEVEKERQKLEDTQRRMAADAKKLDDEKKKLEANKNNLEDKVKQLQRENERIKELENKVKNLEREKEEDKKRSEEEIKRAAQILDQEREALKAALKNVDAEKNKISELQRNITEAEKARLAQEKAHEEALRKAAEKAKQAEDSLKSDLRKNELQLQELRGRQLSHERELTEHVKTVTSKNSEIAELQSQISELNKKARITGQEFKSEKESLVAQLGVKAQEAQTALKEYQRSQEAFASEKKMLDAVRRELVEQNQALTQGLARQVEKMTELGAQLTSKSDEVLKLTLQLKQTEEAHKARERALNDQLEHSRRMALDQKKKFDEAIESQKDNITRLSRHIDRLNHELTGVKQETSAKAIKLKGQISQLMVEKNKTEEERNALVRKRDEQASKIEKLETSIEQHKGIIHNLEANIRDKDSELQRKTEEHKRALETERARANLEKKNLEERLSQGAELADKLNTHIRENQTQIEHLTDLQATSQKEVVRLNAEIKTKGDVFDAARKHLEKELKQANEKVSEVSRLLAAVNKENERLNSGVKELTFEKENLQRELKDRDKEIFGLNQRISEQETVMSDLRNKMIEQERKHAHELAEQKRVSEQLERDLNAKLEAERKKVVNQEQTIVELSREVESEKNKKDKTIEDLRRNKQALIDLEARHAEALEQAKSDAKEKANLVAQHVNEKKELMSKISEQTVALEKYQEKTNQLEEANRVLQRDLNSVSDLQKEAERLAETTAARLKEEQNLRQVQVAQLTREKDELASKNVSLLSRIEALNANIDRLEREKVVTAQVSIDLEKARREVTLKNEELTQLNNLLVTKNTDLKTANERLEHEKNEALTAARNHQARAEDLALTLRRERESRVHEVAELSDKLQKAQQQVQGLHQALEKEQARLMEEGQERNAINAQLQSRTVEFEQAKASLQGIISELTDKNRQLEVGKKEIEGIAEKFQNRAKELEQTLENERKLALDHETQLKGKLGAYEVMLEKLKGNERDNQREIEELKRSKEALNEQIQVSEKRVGSLSKELNNIRDELEKERNLHAQALAKAREDAIEAQRRFETQLKESDESSKKQIEQLLADKTREIQSLNRELAREKADRLREQAQFLAKISEERERAVRERKKLNQTIAEKERRLSEFDRELARGKSEADTLSHLIAQSKTKVEHLTKALETALADQAQLKAGSQEQKIQHERLISDLKQQLKEQEERSNAEKAFANARYNEIAGKNAALIQLQANIEIEKARLNAELSARNHQIEGLRQDLAKEKEDRKREAEKFAQEKNQMKENLEVLKAEVSKFQSQIDEINKKREKTQDELRDLNRLQNDLLTKNNQLIAERKKVAENLAAEQSHRLALESVIAQERSSAQQESNRLKDEIQLKNSEMDSLRAVEQRNAAKISDLDQKLLKEQDRIREIEAQLNTVKGTDVEKQKRIHALELSMKTAQMAAAEAASAKASLLLMNRELEARRVQVSEENKSLQDRLSEEQEAARRARTELETEKNKSHEAAGQLKQTQAQLINEQNTRKEVEAALQKSSMALEAAERQAQQAWHERNAAIEREHRVEANLREKVEALERLKNQAAEATDKLNIQENELKRRQEKLEAQEKESTAQIIALKEEQRALMPLKEKVREQDQQLGLQKNEHQRELAAFKEILAEKERVITEKERVIAERERVITERAQLLAENDRLLIEKNRQLSEKESRYAEEERLRRQAEAQRTEAEERAERAERSRLEIEKERKNEIEKEDAQKYAQIQRELQALEERRLSEQERVLEESIKELEKAIRTTVDKVENRGLVADASSAPTQKQTQKMQTISLPTPIGRNYDLDNKSKSDTPERATGAFAPFPEVATQGKLKEEAVAHRLTIQQSSRPEPVSPSAPELQDAATLGLGGSRSTPELAKHSTPLQFSGTHPSTARLSSDQLVSARRSSSSGQREDDQHFGRNLSRDRHSRLDEDGRSNYELGLITEDDGWMDYVQNMDQSLKNKEDLFLNVERDENHAVSSSSTEFSIAKEKKDRSDHGGARKEKIPLVNVSRDQDKELIFIKSSQEKTLDEALKMMVLQAFEVCERINKVNDRFNKMNVTEMNVNKMNRRVHEMSEQVNGMIEQDSLRKKNNKLYIKECNDPVEGIKLQAYAEKLGLKTVFNKATTLQIKKYKKTHPNELYKLLDTISQEELVPLSSSKSTPDIHRKR